jgi:hypothetical protein
MTKHYNETLETLLLEIIEGDGYDSLNGKNALAMIKELAPLHDSWSKIYSDLLARYGLNDEDVYYTANVYAPSFPGRQYAKMIKDVATSHPSVKTAYPQH